MAEYPPVYTFPEEPHQDSLDPSSWFTTPVPSQQHTQGDRNPFDVSFFDSSYTPNTFDPDTFQSPGTLDLNDVPTTYSSSPKDHSDHNLSNRSVYQTSYTTDCIDPALYADPHRVINTYGPASSATLFSNVNCRDHDGWQEELQRATSGVWPIASSFPTDATPVGDLAPQALGNHENLFSSMTDFNANSTESMAQSHQGSSLKRKFSSLEPPKDSAESHIPISHLIHPMINSNWLRSPRVSATSHDLAGKHLVPWEVYPNRFRHQQDYPDDPRHSTIITHSHTLHPRQAAREMSDDEYAGPTKPTAKRRRIGSATNNVNLSCASPAPVARDEDLDMFAELTTLVDDESKESRGGGGTSDPQAEHFRTLQTSRGTGSQNMYQRRRKHQPRRTPNAGFATSESQQKKKMQQQISNRNRRDNPKVLYFCANPTCKASWQQGVFGGFVTKEDARRHLKIHETRNFTCLAAKEGCEKRFHRAEALKSHCGTLHPQINLNDPRVQDKIDLQWEAPPLLEPGQNIVVMDAQDEHSRAGVQPAHPGRAMRKGYA